jgi:hypothetical protein
LEGINLLELTPRRLAEWHEKDGRVVLHRPTPTSSGLKRVLDWFFYHMSARRIRLDDVGSFAWFELDGGKSVSEVAHLVRGNFGDAAEPVEQRLGHLIRVLHQEKLLAYPGFDDNRLVDRR